MVIIVVMGSQERVCTRQNDWSESMAYTIYLICVAMNSVLMSHLDISLTQWEYWVSLTLMVVSWMCGTEYGNKHKS